MRRLKTKHTLIGYGWVIPAIAAKNKKKSITVL